VSAIISEEMFYELDAPIMRLCGADIPAVGMAPTIEKFFLLNPDKVKEAMLRLAEI
jgi:2-oxoisovalerate dehydrogenase E1 component beta subunit